MENVLLQTEPLRLYLLFIGKKDSNVMALGAVIVIPFNWQHISLIQMFYLKQSGFVSLCTVILWLIEVLIHLMLICSLPYKKDSIVNGGLFW